MKGAHRVFSVADSQGVVAKVGEAAGVGQGPQRVVKVTEQLQSQTQQSELCLPRGEQGGANLRPQGEGVM